jgi:predicted MFS family arabinose efflux permease
VAFPSVALLVREPEGSIKEGSAGTTTQAGLSVAESLRSSSFWLIAASVLLVVTTINGIVGHLVPMLTDRGLNVGQAAATLSAVGISTIAGRLAAGYLLDRFFAPYVAAGLFLLPLIAISLLTTGVAGPGPVLAAMSLGFGLGAEVDVIGFLVSRYFGLRAYGEVYGYLFAIFTLGTGFGPVLMAICFDMTQSYNVALIGLAAALVCASILITRLGTYRFPAHRAGARAAVSSHQVVRTPHGI